MYVNMSVPIDHRRSLRTFKTIIYTELNTIINILYKQHNSLEEANPNLNNLRDTNSDAIHKMENILKLHVNLPSSLQSCESKDNSVKHGMIYYEQAAQCKSLLVHNSVVIEKPKPTLYQRIKIRMIHIIKKFMVCVKQENI
jgi:hypothetical protein